MRESFILHLKSILGRKEASSGCLVIRQAQGLHCKRLPAARALESALPLTSSVTFIEHFRELNLSLLICLICKWEIITFTFSSLQRLSEGVDISNVLSKL